MPDLACVGGVGGGGGGGDACSNKVQSEVCEMEKIDPEVKLWIAHPPPSLISMPVIYHLNVSRVFSFLTLSHSLVSLPNLFELDSTPVSRSCLPSRCEMEL